MPKEELTLETEYNDAAMLRYTLIALILVALVFYLMLGFQVDTVTAADFTTESKVTWVCPLTPFH